MLLNLATILILGRNIEYEFNNLSNLFEVIKKSENKLVKKNGIRALAIFSKLEVLKTQKRFLIKIAEFLILFDNDADNLINSLTFLKANLGILDKKILKQKEFLAKLISLMRFLRHI